ncbi:MAG: U32 family peptidase, partial [Candidatus Riflebacteria bacterium]|nr:U32 family peptidase [Candidatus Riflebacteria bacterium]
GLLARCPPGRVEVAIHHRIAMFHTRHCVVASCLTRASGPPACRRVCQTHRFELRDRIGEDHPLCAGADCHLTIFASRAQSAALYVPDLVAAGVAVFRIELLRESAEQARRLVDAYARLVAALDDPETALARVRAVAAAAVTTGTLDHA